MKIKSKLISKDNFKEYGEVVTLPSILPTSEDNTYTFWSNIASYKINGSTEIGICKVFEQDAKLIDGMERHSYTPEILIPIDGPFILPLLLDGLDESKAEAFFVDIGQAVVIKENVWHGACIPAKSSESSYFVIFKKDTPHSDVEKKKIRPTIIEIMDY